MCSCNKICQSKKVKANFFDSCLMELFCSVLSYTYPVIFLPSFLKWFELLTFHFRVLIFGWLSEVRLPCVCLVFRPEFCIVYVY